MGSRRYRVLLPLIAAGFGLSACDGQLGQGLANLDFDLRNNAGGLDTSSAARAATANRPKPDSRGIISYSNYQVAVARRGDSVTDVATRIGYDPGYLARFNGLRPDDVLNSGEVLALPRDVQTAAAPGAATQPLNVEQIATSAIDRAPQSQITRATPSKRIDGPEPVRHQVARGETAYSIARLYNVSVRSLAEWNGLGPDLEVRQDQYLLIPVSKIEEKVAQATPAPAPAPAPKPQTAEPASGTATATPLPPSSTKPLPEPVPPAKAPEPAAAPAASKLLPPVTGKVLRPYKKRKNEGIDIASSAGTAVRAAGDGVVAAITRDTEQVPILVLRHPGNLLTVYANITDIAVKKGDTIKRGQTVAKVGPGSPAFVHFEVREGFDSVDPAPFLK